MIPILSYAGGLFSNMGGVSTADHLARWDGSSWKGVGGWNGAVVASISATSSGLYLGGSFYNAMGNPAMDRVARWDGTSWHTLGSGLNSTVYAVAALGQNIYACGLFNNVSNFLARWDGAAWHPLPGATGPIQRVKAAGGDIYVTGGSNLVPPHQYVARLVAGAVWTSPSDIHFFLTNPPVSGVIPRAKAIAVVGSKVYLGGNFPSLP